MNVSKPPFLIGAARFELRLFLSLLIFTAFGPTAKAIVGVSTPAPELAPYVVMVLARNGVASGFCSASVVAQDVVLTAAHCVADPSNTRIHFRGESGEPVLADVKTIMKHPGYRADAAQSRQRSIDLALIRLTEPLPLRFKPVQIGEPSAIEPGRYFRIAGFGVTQEGGDASSGNLHAGRLAVRPPLSQILLWLNDPLGRGTGACQGDSGGPIFADDQPLLVAVTDWAEGSGRQKCGKLTQAGLIAPQKHWIESILAAWSEQRGP